MVGVNYEELATNYDRCRALTEEKAQEWVDLFANHLGLDAGSRVLDVGCGTGRFATLIAGRLGCRVTGIDPSPSMLAIARAKPIERVSWVQAQAEDIPLAAGAFDACLASQVIHHFTDRPRAFAEISRVLRPGGRLAIRFSTHEQLVKFIDYRFFHSALDIDRTRSPDKPVVEQLLWDAGFSVRWSEPIRQPLAETAAEYLQKLRRYYSSVLTLISEAEYQKGLAQAEKELGEQELAEEDRYAELTFLVAVKEGAPHRPGYSLDARPAQPPVATPAVSCYNAGERASSSAEESPAQVR